MSNQDNSEKTVFTSFNEFTIKGSGDRFSVEAEGKTHQGSVTHEGGGTQIQLGREEASRIEAQVPRGSKSFMNVEGTLQTDAYGNVKHLGVFTATAPQHNADPRFLVGSLVDLKGTPCGDLRAAANHPENYLVTVGGIQTPLKNAVRLGLVQIDGNGQLHENHRNIAATINPRDPSIPGRDQAPPMEVIPFNEAEFVAMDTLIQRTGLDTSSLLAKALGAKGDSAGKELADVLPGTSPQEAQELLLGVAQVRIQSVAALIEKAGGLEEGDGFEYIDRALNHTSPATKARLAHGLMVGSRAVINEVINIGATKDRY